MKVSIYKRKRILLLFALGIGLPSLLLGYLAFRGIQNDRALLEKERLDEQRRIAERIAKDVESNIYRVEQAFFSTIVNRREMSWDALVRSLENLKTENPLIEQIFYFQEFEAIRLPAARLLYLPDGSRKPVSPLSRPSSLAKKIQSAQQLEFQQRNYPKALVAYQQVLDQTTEHRIKGELLNAVARIQRKSAFFKDAVTTYEIIARDYGQVLISEGIPLGLAARLELGSLILEMSNFSGSIKTFMDLYKSLVDQEWALEKAQYEIFAKRVRDSIVEILSKSALEPQTQSYRDAFSFLEKEEREKRERTERALAFQESAASDLEAKISSALSEPSDSPVRFALDVGKYSYLVSTKNQAAENEGQPGEAWGILLDSDWLLDQVLNPALQQSVSKEETAWVVRGRNGQSLLKSENLPSGMVTVRANFASNFPDWSLEFYQPPPQLLKTFLASRHGLYFYIFLLIAGILVFGLILTIRAVSHELELAKMKSDFVSTISHEFKSPLTSLRQIAEMLQSGRVPSEERRQQYYDVLLEQSERLSLLTDNILNLAKIEEGRKEFAFEKTDIGALLREVVSSIQDRVRHEGFHIELKIEDPLPVITADRAAITQAIANLIDNAIKYSGESRKVIVSSFREGPNLTIAVKDFGIGIKRDEVDRVFERFYRGGDELTRTVKGSGLGLTLVREIVEAHQGKVDVESELGEGSLFSIRFPISQREDK
jgi:signal transduction histidine kinase